MYEGKEIGVFMFLVMFKYPGTIIQVMKMLDFNKSEKLARKYKLSLPKQELAKNLKQAIDASKKIKYPLVIKLISPDLIHKTDMKAVMMDIRNEEELEECFYTLQKSAKNNKARFDGVLIQERIHGAELIIGGKKDVQFGSVVIFGIGGIMVEIMNDITMKIIPLTRKDGENMLEEIKGKNILEGVRGMGPVNKKELVDLLLKMSRIMETEKIEEIDLNPVMCNPKGCYCVDIRVLKE